MHLRLVRRQLGEHATEAAARPRRAQGASSRRRSSRVALVEHEVDDLEDRRQPFLERLAARHLERHVRVGERLLGADDPLLDRRDRKQERAAISSVVSPPRSAA
jgi:hypothetical protein